MIDPNDNNPMIVDPINNQIHWSRASLIDWILNKIKYRNYLIGVDFAFSHPYYDYNSFFPNLSSSPKNVEDLWDLMDKVNSNQDNFYGGNIWCTQPYSEYYNSYYKKGINFKTRRRLTELNAKKIYTPSSTFNCVGPGSVGTGSLSGMRVLNFFKKKINIWPFNKIKYYKSNLVEIFPTYYFRNYNINPEKNIGYSIEKLNYGLIKYGSNPVSNKIKFIGPDQDEADALISVAAMKYFSKINKTWEVPHTAKKEGWIFGV